MDIRHSLVTLVTSIALIQIFSFWGANPKYLGDKNDQTHISFKTIRNYKECFTHKIIFWGVNW